MILVPPAGVRVNVEVVSVVASTAREKIARAIAPGETPVDRAAGTCVVIVSASAVVNVQDLVAAIAVPSAPLTAVVNVAVY